MRLSTIVCHIGNTMFGMYQRKFSSAWDFQLSNLIDNAEIINADEHTITFKSGEDEISVWCENRCYAFGHIWMVNNLLAPKEKQFRPRIRTMERLYGIYLAKRESDVEREYIGMFRGDSL